MTSEAPSQRFSLVYSAPAECPSRSAFLTALRERAPAATEADVGVQGVVASVELAPRGALFAGALSVRLPDGAETRRDVPAAACAEVADSMAVMLAMILEPREPAEAEAATPVRRQEKPPARQRAPSPTRKPAAPGRDDASSLRLGATIGGVTESGAAPLPNLGASAGVDVWLERRGPLSPSARLALVYLERSADTDAGSATFRWTAARLSACPLRFPAFTVVFARACAVFDAGELVGSGENVANDLDAAMPWLAAGVSARFELPLPAFLTLEIEGAVRALSRHDQFVLRPGPEVVHDVPRLSVGVGLVLTGRIPRAVGIDRRPFGH